MCIHDIIKYYKINGNHRQAYCGTYYFNIIIVYTERHQRRCAIPVRVQGDGSGMRDGQ